MKITKINKSSFLQLHAQIEGSDIETEADSLAIKELMKRRDQMCSDLIIGAGINPEGITVVFDKLTKLFEVRDGGIEAMLRIKKTEDEILSEIKKALIAAKLT